LMVTHDDDVAAAAQRIAHMKDGKVLDDSAHGELPRGTAGMARVRGPVAAPTVHEGASGQAPPC
jgi:hypothetical protein